MLKKLFLVVDESRPNHVVTVANHSVTRTLADDRRTYSTYDIWVSHRPSDATICTSAKSAKALLKKAKTWIRRELRNTNREATRPNTKSTVYTAMWRRQARKEAKILKGIKLKVVPYKAC